MNKLLIVEDDTFILDAYKAKFSTNKSFVVDYAMDGEEALIKINSI